MSKQLYEEALADVKKLKEVAEDNAKRALLEAVTPRIRELIESQLLGETQVTGAAARGELLFDEDMNEFPEIPEIRFSGDQNPENVPVNLKDKFPTGGVGIDVAVTGYPSSSAECLDDVDVDMIYPTSNPKEEVYTLSVEAAKALKVLSNKRHLSSFQFEALLRNVNKKIRAALNSSRTIKESASYSRNIATIISEVKNMYVHLQTNLRSTPKKKSYESILENYYLTLKRLTEQKMKNRRNLRNLNEMEVTLDIPVEGEDAEKALRAALEDTEVALTVGDGEEGDELEFPDDEDTEGNEGEEDDEMLPGGDAPDDDMLPDDEEEEEEEEVVDDGDEEEEDNQMEARRLGDNLVVEIDEGMLRREISRMKALREESETKPQSWGHGAGNVGDGFEDEDLGDPFVDIDLREDDAAGGQGRPGDKGRPGKGDDKDDLSEVDSMMDQNYGMDQGTDDEPVDNKTEPKPNSNDEVSETLRRALSREARIQFEAKKKAGMAKRLAEAAARKQKPTKKLKEAYNFFARKFNESVRRSNKMRSVLTEAARRRTALNGRSARSATETRNLRTKLAETNLFNAKLLFTNKLLQNESLTKRQKAEVIERLDEARSEREVKLVYESVTRSLQGVAARRMTETADRGVMGSSSRPASRASTNLNEGIESDRWARLAGIIK